MYAANDEYLTPHPFLYPLIRIGLPLICVQRYFYRNKIDFFYLPKVVFSEENDKSEYMNSETKTFNWSLKVKSAVYWVGWANLVGHPSYSLKRFHGDVQRISMTHDYL